MSLTLLVRGAIRFAAEQYNNTSDHNPEYIIDRTQATLDHNFEHTIGNTQATLDHNPGSTTLQPPMAKNAVVVFAERAMGMLKDVFVNVLMEVPMGGYTHIFADIFTVDLADMFMDGFTNVNDDVFEVTMGVCIDACADVFLDEFAAVSAGGPMNVSKDIYKVVSTGALVCAMPHV